MSDSPLVEFTLLSPHRWPRTMEIDMVAVHCFVGQAAFGRKSFQDSRVASANYIVYTDGRVGLYVPENQRSACTSSTAVDNRAVTIEVASDSTHPYAVNDKAYTGLIRLLVDICQRNPKLNNGLRWKADKSLIGKPELQNMTAHRWFANKACLPVNRTELLTPTGWKLLRDIQVDDIVATAHIDDLSISFEPVLDKVEERIQDTWVVRDLEATADHRVMWYAHNNSQRVTQFKEYWSAPGNSYLPNAGVYSGVGLDLCRNELELLIAVQADGHYMKDADCHYGVEFHLKKDRKINRVVGMLDALSIDYKRSEQQDGSKKIRIYGKAFVEWCEAYLHNKRFTWRFIEMSPEQAAFFLDRLLDYDGSRDINSYFSSDRQNIDVVSAIASINNVGVLLGTDGKQIAFKKPTRSLGVGKRDRRTRQKVSCVTVPSGFILIRQDRRTTIVGNCPGDYLYERFGQIADEVNAKLKGELNVTQYEELKKENEALKKEIARINDLIAPKYETLDQIKNELPWGYEAVKDAVNRRIIKGTSDDGLVLDLSLDDIRALMLDYNREKAQGGGVS